MKSGLLRVCLEGPSRSQGLAQVDLSVGREALDFLVNELLGQDRHHFPHHLLDDLAREREHTLHLLTREAQGTQLLRERALVALGEQRSGRRSGRGGWTCCRSNGGYRSGCSNSRGSSGPGDGRGRHGSWCGAGN